MAKMKVYELAKEIDKQSRDIINYLKDNGIDIKSHMSNMEENHVNLVKNHFLGAAKPAGKTAVNQMSSNQQAVQNSQNRTASTQGGQNSQVRPTSAQGGQNNQARPASAQGGQNSQVRPTSAQGGQNSQTRPASAQGGQNRPGSQYGQSGQNRHGNTDRQSGQNRYHNSAQNEQNRPMGQSGQNRQSSQYSQNRQGNQTGSGNQFRRNNQNQSTDRQSQGRQNNQSRNSQYNSGNYGQRPAGQNRSMNQGQYRQNKPMGQDGQNQQMNSQQGRTNSYNNSDRYSQNPGHSYNSNTQGGRQGGSNYNQNRSGGNNTYQNRNYNNSGFNFMDKDKDDNVKNYGNKKGSGRSDAKKTEKKVDAPLGMSRSDSAIARNNRTNKNIKNKNYGHKDIEEDNILETIKPYKKGQFIKPKVEEPKEEEIKTIVIPEVITIKELADKMKLPSAALVKKLFLAGKMVSINQEITFEEAEEIALEYDIIAEEEVKIDVIEELLKEDEEDESTLEKRPPVVCVMGHVDHGKTSLLDAIRKANVTSHEAGGITQHIGAYVVEVNGEKVTFLDTPGHEAFTSMRMRGAQSTDIAILVVAADDGVMPQTIEAISHAKAAGIQIIVAINKIDKPSANIERVKQELTEYGLVAEDWGGDTVFVPVSAHTKEGIPQLLEMIVLTAEIAELKANPNRKARGVVIEAELDKGRGSVATILVQKGTLNVGDSIVIGSAFGKVRAMMDDKGRRVKEATPSTPVEILGLNEVPEAGETFMATETEKEARSIAETYISQGREKLLADTKAKLSLDGLFSQIKAGEIKELNIIVKADVQGSVEAVKQSLEKLSNEEVAVRIIHGGVGAVNESDVILASASNAIVIGFNVRPDNAAKETADREKVDIRLYRVIYNAIEDVEAAMKGMLDPIFQEKVIGHADVRQTFKASGLGTIAGSYVTDGKIVRGCSARIIRDGIVIFDGALASLKRFKDDVKEVASGYECGLVFEKFNDVKEEDTVELYIMEEIPR
ncbi:MAG: translation initiation factor IF-2 [Anaerocolumna aminovalerica]|uniref:translation initiation factor IF-2 n=2 Tax=Anaerocolumna aminovalerica TaxID=1527 RepID=UPI00290F3648|nr:translation initiation factor IF-2 [Anaerocolumna aminovalerica]MDU6263802.1 translation initiation factor IF-2 [Anaerocolumna aminovalerica]